MRFKWGDTVRIAAEAPDHFRPGHQGSVCGVRVVETEDHAQLTKEQIGTALLLVEFGDGQAVEIPERFLEQGESTNHY